MHPDQVRGLSGLPPGEHLAGGWRWPRLGLARAGSVTPGLTGCRRRPRPEGATADRPPRALQGTGHGRAEASGGRGPAPPRAAHSIGAGTAGRGEGVLPAQLL